MITFQDLCLVTMLVVWATLRLVVQWADRRDRKDKGLAVKDTDRISTQCHVAGTSPGTINLRTQDRSVSPINVSHAGSRSQGVMSDVLGASHKSSIECLTLSVADTLSLSSVSELLMSSASEVQSSLSHTQPNTYPVPSKDVSRARFSAQGATYDRNESGISGSAEEDIQRNELGITRDSDVVMEARRRRRFLERTSDVSATESSSWRSKVYQKENTNTSNSSSFQNKETPWISYRTKDTLSSIDNHTQESDSPVESRRRRSEDSNCGDLSERLARRRASRLEEKRGSLSNDGSLDGQCDLNRQWSRDSSIKSLDSCEVADQDDRLSDRWSKRCNEHVPSGRRGSRNTCDSLVFPGNIDNYEDVKDKLHKPSQGNESSNRTESAAATAQVVPRKWSSKDSNFYSADSMSSLRSYDDGRNTRTTQHRHTSLGQECAEREPTSYSGSRRGQTFQNWSEDSAFSEMKETAEDTLNTNNNNDNSAMADLPGIPIGPSVKRGMDSSKSKAGEVGGTMLGTLGSWVGEISQSSSNMPEVTADVSDTTGSQLTSQQREAARSEASLSLSGLNDALKATSRKGGIAKIEDLSCWRGSFNVSASNVTSQTGRQGTDEVHAEDSSTTNAVQETREATLTAQDHRDVDSSSTTSSQPRESNTHRKRRTRKDKSALRKSALNMADAPMEAEGTTHVQHDPGQSEDRPRRRQLTATKQKFMQNATATTEASSTPSLKPKTEANDEVAPIKIARSSTGFSQLLQKFSGSESNSEKSDTEVGASVVSGIPKRRSLVRRQEAKEVITSSEESDTRRTPDRTQSLKLPSRREDIKSVGHSENNSSLRSDFPDASAVVEKSPSFRSEFMTRKWAGRSIDASHNEKETSPLKTVEPSKVGVGHAESKADIGISAAVSGQHNRTAFSKGQSLAVGSSDVQGQRQGLSILGNKHKDSKTTSQSTALVHNEATITKQDDAVPTATALADKSKRHSVNVDLISKYNQPPSSEKLASRHVFPSSDSKQEKQVASLHIAKDTHTSVTTPGKVELDKAKNPNTVVDLVPKHKESVISDKLASVHVASQSSSENKHVIRAAEVSKQVGSSVKTAAKVAIDNTKNPDTDQDLVSSDKLASSHVASQRDSESKPDIRTVEVNIRKQVDASLITTAKVSVDKTKNHNTDLDLVTKHTESVISDISASSHVASQRGSDNKPGSRAAEVSKQIDVSVTAAKKVAIDNTNNPNTELDLVSRHTVISDKLASSHAASQSSSESKRAIRVAEVSKQSGASVTTAAKVAIDKTKNLKTDLDLVSKHKESAISDKLVSVHVASQSSSENTHVIRTAEVSKQVGSSVKTAAKVAVDNTKNPNTDPDLVSRHTVISDMSPSSHVASQSSLESKPDIHAVGVNVSKQVDTSAKTAEKVLMDKVKSPNTNIDLISKHSEVPTIDMKASQRVASTNSPESKLELPSAKENIIQQGVATSVTTTVTAGTEKPKNTNLDLISESNELVTRHNSASGHVASASSSDSKPKTIVAEVNVSKLADSSVTTTLQMSKDKAKGCNTNLDLISKHSESSTREMSASHDVASSMNPERKHDVSPTTDTSVTHSADKDTSQHREHPVAKPRNSLERESTPETRVTNESSTYVQSADVTSTPSVSSTLTTSVSSPGLQTSNASSEIASSNTAEVRRASSFKEATVTRTESMEKRKGILKRNTSLNKHDTLEAAGNGGFPVIDPQLAKILMQRKQMVGDGDAIDEAEEKKDEVSELVRRPRPLSAAEEIEENLRYSMQKAAQRGMNADDDEGLKRISVADRIYSMQNKIEEEKFAALTPKSRSGLSTPRSRPRSGFMTPTNQKSFDETIHQQLSMSSSMTTVTSTVATVSAVSQAATKQEEPQPSRSSTAVSGPQLMEKLSELASATERYQEKRHRFQHRARNDWRYQTQPVTYEEIQAADRYINRKKRERSQTMPITEEEVKSASEMGSGGCDIVNSSKTAPVSQPEPEVVSRSRSSSITEDDNKEVEKDDDELTKLSLSEKVKLFSQPREPEKQPAKTEAPVVRRRNRKVASRFNTQPVTNEEVEKAAASTRISPLAMSLVKPPDTEILKGLPLKDQRELVALHAEMYLSKTVFRSRSGSSASQSQTSSRRASVSLEEEEAKKSEKEDWSEKGDKKGILKDKSASAKDLHDTKSILKTEPTKAKSESEVHSILKMEVKHILEPTPVASEPRGILKKTRSEDMSVVEGGDDIKGILKHIDSEEEECQGKPRSRSNSQPLGILKSEGFSPINEHSAEIKSILKAPSQENVHDSQTIKSAMRRGSIESDISVTTATSSLKSAMRTRNRNSLDADDLQTAGADAKTVSQEGDLNSNNSQKHMSMSVQSSEVTVDHFSSVTHGKFTSVASSTIIKSSSTVESRTSSSASTTVTAATTSVSSLQVPAGSEDRSGQSASDDGESSSGEILDSTPRTSKLKRKSRFSDKTAQVERYKTQPPELPDSASSASTPADTPGRRKYKYEGRHRTQPITPDEMREAEAATPVSDLTRTPGGSIADRLNQLKTSGEQEWKKRVGRNEDILTTPEVIKLREKPGLSDHRPTSIADRLNELETSMTTWKERVEESDAKQFTVAARLTQGSTDSPLVNKLKNLPRKDESGSRGNTPLSSPVTPTKELIAKIPLPKDIVQDTTIVVEAVKTTVSSDRKKEEEDEKRESVTVEVPDMGEEVENFFAVKPIEEIKDTVNLEVDDFDNMFIEAEMILTNIHKVRPKRKIKSSSRNPLKTMSQKLEIRQEYTEVMYGTAEKELKRVKKEGLAKDAGFAQAALAGLASTENFKQVELRRTDSGSSVHGQAYDPFKEPMLLHVKGRRSVQIRLVEPHSRSINEGDCYVLVTSDKVIYWEGQFANVIEKAKANEVASYIQQKKDLGCKKAAEVQTVYPLKDHLGPGKQFWASLEGEKQLQGCGPDTEDELYESSIVKCNMVYRLEGNALLPYTEYWGATLKHEMLKKNEVIVFDFGTEFYVWQGKAVSMEQRRLGMKLSKQLYEKGYNYTESPLNPMSPLRSEDCGGLSLSSPTRPSWTIFGKVNQNMETILFREKFADWPDSSRLIGCKGVAASESLNKDLLELKPFDAKKMIPINTAPVSLKLEGANVGRGVKWSEDMQGFVKEQDIITLDVTVWHVLEYEHYKLPDLSHGQFHDGDTYVVRWQYMIANANMRSLKGSAARNSLTGRERCAYFFWQGNESTINEKGASALMTVELDEERGPQIRVLQGKEPPCFLNLFDGKMIVHIGKREDPSTNSQGSWRLYCMRGDYENEVYLLEIPVSIKHLRSRSSVVLLNVKTGIVYIWHGAKSPKHVRELCLKVVNKLKENTPLEVGLHEKATITVIEVEEGEEKREIWSVLDQQDRDVYNSLLRDPKPYSHTIRLFHMSSVSLVFEVQEQLNPARVPDLTTPFPFLQSDIYKATQPALFLVDNDYEVYLWQGWWPIGSEDTENVHTGSAIARFNLDRRLAMETTLHYCKEKNPRSPPTAYLVCAGVEPVNFISLFPFWEEDSTVKDIAVEERKTPGYTEKVSDILRRLTQTRYTLTELQERPLPEGVDPLRLETYLQDAEFEEILDMNREEFYAQPNWKQIEMKKHVGLF